mgnify:CR=1 FL=1
MWYDKNQNFFNDVINKKLLNKSVFEKFYVRGSLLGLKNIQILDNNCALYNFPVQIQPKFSNTKVLKYVEGFSLNASSFFYRNKFTCVTHF